MISGLTTEQRTNAIQRLTALWAFTESGLGGIMHALQIPFTGLVVGGMAIVMISLIAAISDHNYKQLLKAAVIVLIVKAMVSPYTPFPAYIAVSFQALLGYALFSLLNVNFISILFLSSMAMLESAIQKILILTLFFGQSLWKAMDSMLAFIADQFGHRFVNGSYWIIGIYLVIYLVAGVLVAWFSYSTIRNFDPGNSVPSLNNYPVNKPETALSVKPERHNIYKKLWVFVFCMIGVSVVLFMLAADSKHGWLAVAKTISWTLSAILIWFMLIGPLFTKSIQKLLQKKQSRYSDEVLKTLSFLPVLRRLTSQAWQQSKPFSGFRRWHFFLGSLIHATLTYTES